MPVTTPSLHPPGHHRNSVIRGQTRGGGVFTLEVIINVKSTLVVVDNNRSNIKEGATGQNLFKVFVHGSFSSSLEDGLLALQVL